MLPRWSIKIWIDPQNSEFRVTGTNKEACCTGGEALGRSTGQPASRWVRSLLFEHAEVHPDYVDIQQSAIHNILSNLCFTKKKHTTGLLALEDRVGICASHGRDLPVDHRALRASQPTVETTSGREYERKLSANLWVTNCAENGRRRSSSSGQREKFQRSTRRMVTCHHVKAKGVEAHQRTSMKEKKMKQYRSLLYIWKST